MKYLFLDLETTGLDPADDRIVEAAFVLTNHGLNELAVGQEVACFYDWPDCHPTVIKMHGGNGLMVEAMLCPTDVDGIDKAFDQILCAHHDVDGKEKLILAGNSVHFDRGFIKRYMPLLERRLHYRHLDVSAVLMACELAGHKIEKSEPVVHRAMADVRQSVELLHRALAVIRGGAEWINKVSDDAHGAFSECA